MLPAFRPQGRDALVVARRHHEAQKKSQEGKDFAEQSPEEAPQSEEPEQGEQDQIDGIHRARCPTHSRRARGATGSKIALCLTAQHLFDQVADLLAVGPARNLGHHLLHHPPQVLNSLRADLFDGALDRGAHLFLAHGRGQKTAENPELRLFLPEQIGPSALAEELDRLLPLLAKSGYGFLDLFRAELAVQLDLFVVERRQQKAERRENDPVAALHGGFHPVLNFSFQFHSRTRGAGARALKVMAPGAPQGSLLRRDGLLLALDAGLFVMLALTQLGQDAGLLAQLFKAPDGAFDGFVVSDSYSRHLVGSPPLTGNPYSLKRQF